MFLCLLSIVTIVETIQFFPKDKTCLGFSRDNDYQIPVAIIHKHYLYVKATFVAACTTVYFDTMGCFSIVKNVQFPFF